MPEVTQRKIIDDTLDEIEQRLRASAPGPAVRELRVRLGALARVVRGWAHATPHDDQIAAMLECLVELSAAVNRARGAGARPRDDPASGRSSPPSRPGRRMGPLLTTRPPPRRSAATRTTRPPPRRPPVDAPPSSRR